MEENVERVSYSIAFDEHSYCVSSQPNSHSEESELSTTGIFESSSPVPEGRFTIPVASVNFHGSNYTIPCAIGESVELNGTPTLAGAKDINTVEIIAADVEDETNNGPGPNVSALEVGCDKSKLSRSRRRDFIEDCYSRQRYFNEGFQKLAAHLYRAMSRTSCEGDLIALFEGGILNLSQVTDPTKTDSDSSDATPVTSERRPSIGNTEADHPYAATILMQRVSSPSIKDHQYDEKTLIPVNELDDLEDNNTDGEGRKRKRLERTGYIKARWARDQTFGKFTKSMFREKAILQDRTGATVILTLKYDRSCINEENYSDVFDIVASSRKRVPSKKPRLLAPKPKFLPLQPVTPLSFVLPTFHTIPQHSPFFLSQPNTISSGDIQFVASETEDNDERICVIESTESAAESDLNSSVNQPATSQNFIRENRSETVFTTSVPVQINNASDSCDEVMYLVADENEQEQCAAEPKSPIVSSKSFKDSASGTETICSTCHATTPADVNGPTYWIRCNDAFCYDMVHTSCVGFMISCKSHLKQLPPYYCKTHRS